MDRLANNPPSLKDRSINHLKILAAGVGFFGLTLQEAPTHAVVMCLEGQSDTPISSIGKTLYVNRQPINLQNVSGEIVYEVISGRTGADTAWFVGQANDIHSLPSLIPSLDNGALKTSRVELNASAGITYTAGVVLLSIPEGLTDPTAVFPACFSGSYLRP